MTTGDCYLWTLPMFHANGWTFTWTVTAAGARHVCLPQFDAQHCATIHERRQDVRPLDVDHAGSMGPDALSRRQFSRTAGLVAGSLVAVPVDAQPRDDAARAVPDVIRALSPLPGAPPFITDDERRARIDKARRLMAEQGLGAIVLEPGTSMAYFVNVRWGLSERPFLLVIPAKGELAYVAPAFEENRAREITKFTNDVRVWQEDEDAAAVVAGILKERGVATGKVGVEERVRFFIVDALRKAAPAIEWTLATPVTAGCRMIKSATEIALMQHANDITLTAYKAGLATLHEGMTQNELRDNITAAFARLGRPGRST